MSAPPTHYAHSGEVSIAYQTLGEGPCDLVAVTGPASHLEIMWEEPGTARSFRRMAEYARLILFDRRGTGLSDSGSDPPTLEQQADDMHAVLAAVGSERTAIIGGGDLGLSALFTATYPEMVSSLILFGVAPDGRHWLDGTARTEVLEAISASWGDGALVSLYAPSKVSDPDFVEWWGRMQRSALSPGMARRLMQMSMETSLRDVLPTIQVPTLVCHARGDRVVPIRYGREVAELIPGARFFEYDSEDAYGWTDALLLAEFEEFLTGRRSPPRIDRVLATVMFTDIVDSTRQLATVGDARWRAQLSEHNQVVRDALRRWRGHEVKTSGDGFLATFDGPARAVSCAAEIVERTRPLGLTVRAGLHTGEAELREDDVTGIAVHIAARVMAEAGPGEVLASSTVKDLVIGSGLNFSDRGPHSLRGIEDPWRLFAVQN
ncbi:MAG TPA: adenylate/guanylate cyclase domain-containing protein [Solirubrobacteraceae bacterium]